MQVEMQKLCQPNQSLAVLLNSRKSSGGGSRDIVVGALEAGAAVARGVSEIERRGLVRKSERQTLRGRRLLENNGPD